MKTVFVPIEWSPFRTNILDAPPVLVTRSGARVRLTRSSLDFNLYVNGKLVETTADNLAMSYAMNLMEVGTVAAHQVEVAS